LGLEHLAADREYFFRYFLTIIESLDREVACWQNFDLIF
jgi:hypothetical protein